MSIAGQPVDMIEDRSLRRVMRAGALYDLIAVGPLAIPGLATVQLNVMFWLNNRLGFEGVMPVFGPVEMLFVNMFGVLALFWVFMRLFYYERRFSLVDILLRSLMSILLFFYGMTQDVHALIWMFFGVEVLILCAYLLTRRQRGLGTPVASVSR
jgi:hypothetical protein